MQRKNPSLYSSCKAPVASSRLWPLFLFFFSSFLTFSSIPARSLFAAPPTWPLLWVFPLPGMLFPRIHPANSLTAFKSLLKSHHFNESYPLTLFNIQLFPPPIGSFNPPYPALFFLFFIAFISPFNILCKLLILLILYCLSSLLESKLWETDVCLFCQLVYSRTLELCLAHGKDFVNIW